MPEFRQWRVAAGVLRRESEVLLVQNVRRNGATDWSTPGGVVDEGESFIDALTREVHEETGLVVGGWSGPVYRVEVVSEADLFQLSVETYLATEFSGSLVLDDPDGIVIAHRYVDVFAAEALLEEAARFVSEPLLAHLRDEADHGEVFSFRVDRVDGERVVTRD